VSDHLLDTCVLIDYLRDREAAVEVIRRLPRRPSVSVVTIAELYAGVHGARLVTRNARHFPMLDDLLLVPYQ